MTVEIKSGTQDPKVGYSQPYRQASSEPDTISCYLRHDKQTRGHSYEWHGHAFYALRQAKHTDIAGDITSLFREQHALHR